MRSHRIRNSKFKVKYRKRCIHPCKEASHQIFGETKSKVPAFASEIPQATRQPATKNNMINCFRFLPTKYTKLILNSGESESEKSLLCI